MGTVSDGDIKAAPAWTNPIPMVNFEGVPARLARSRQCAVDPNLPCHATDCMAWVTIKPGATALDQEGNCMHTLHKSVEMQARIREQLVAAMHFAERARYQQDLQMPTPAPAQTN